MSRALEALKSLPASALKKRDPAPGINIIASADPKLIDAVDAVADAVKAIAIPEPITPDKPADYSKELANIAVGIGHILTHLGKPVEKRESLDAAILAELKNLNATNKAILKTLNTPQELTFGDDGEPNGAKRAGLN